MQKLKQEDLRKFYIDDNLTVKEMAQLYNKGVSTIETYLKKYNIKKSKEQIKLIQQKNAETLNNNKIVDDIYKKKLSESAKKRCQDVNYVNPFSKQEVQDKIKQTLGVDNVSQLQGVKDKKKTKCELKKQEKNKIKTSELKEKYKTLDLQSLTRENKISITQKSFSTSRLTEIKEQRSLTKLKRHGSDSYNNLKKSMETCMEKYKVPYAIMLPKARKSKRTNSKTNQTWNKLFKELGFKVKQEFPLESYSYDFIVHNKVLVEINPTYTHQSSHEVFGRILEKDYHIKKTEVALSNNYSCITVWDWDNMDKIIQLLKDKEQIYGRKCNVEFIDQKSTNEFLDEYHIQGSLKQNSLNIGISYENNLIGVMTFGKPRYTKKYQYELLRLCFSDYKVIGGTEKMFKLFLDTIKPESIVSYCDLSKFKGDVYEKLGFKLKGKPKPSAHWSKGRQHITDNLLRQQGFDRLFGKTYGCFGKGTSNEELMLRHRFSKVYDCGQATYIWNKIK